MKLKESLTPTCAPTCLPSFDGLTDVANGYHCFFGLSILILLLLHLGLQMCVVLLGGGMERVGAQTGTAS